MEYPNLQNAIEFIATIIEVLAVVIIAGAIFINLVRASFRLNKNDINLFNDYKNRIGKALQTGLEFLVAADIIRTVTVEPTLQNVLILGLLVLIRTFLSWSIIVESEERWPWQSSKTENISK